MKFDSKISAIFSFSLVNCLSERALEICSKMLFFEEKLWYFLCIKLYYVFDCFTLFKQICLLENHYVEITFTSSYTVEQCSSHKTK